MKQGKIYKYGKEGYIVVDKLLGEPKNGYSAGVFLFIILKKNELSVKLDNSTIHELWIGHSVTPKLLKKHIAAHCKKIITQLKRRETAALKLIDECV